MNKKGQLGMALIIGLAGLFFLAIIYFTMTGPYERIRDEFNSSFSTSEEFEVVKNVDNVWHWAFIILAFTLVLYIVIVALGRQPREYYL